MAQARRRTSRKKGRLGRGLLTLALGVGVGVLAVLLVQFVSERWRSRDGIANLFTAAKPARTETAKAEPDKKDADPARKDKPKYDFYTILPETETVLPERGARPKPDKPARPDRPEDAASYVLQAGSFPTFKDADELKAKLALSGLVAHIQKITIEGKGEFYRVRLGPYDKLEAMESAEQQLKQLGIARPLAIKLRKAAG
jgi:cell division protein FtsN